MRALRGWSRATLAVGISALLCVGALVSPTAGTARADSAPLDPADPTTPVTVSADPLPTAQINGVAWSQVVVGNTVYVAGRFGSSRPAGAPAGTQETPRNNLLAYDIRTGVLNPSFAPNLNGQALVVTASPDGSRIYVGGDFSTADGQDRWRIAAFSTATGQLISSFHPAVGGQVRALAATDTTVYLGGSFTAVGGIARDRLAAVSATDGRVLPWAPVPGVGSTAGNDLPGNNPQNRVTSNEVMALVTIGGGSQVVAAGRFDSLNGIKATGVGALDPVTGETRPFAVNELITNQGVNSAIYSLTTDGQNVYGTGYDFYGPGNVEGMFVADGSSGELVWFEDCHGDTYSAFAAGGTVYVAGHPHVCSNIGGYPQGPSKFALAFSATPSGTVGPATVANSNFVGKPASNLQNWFPEFIGGKVTGQGQAGWSVAGNDQYVVYGGEFPGVNNQPHAGLVRFAVPSIAPNQVGPAASADLTPTVASFAAGTARVSWSTTSDRDNEHLTYSVYRSDRPGTPVYRTTVASTFWQLSRAGFLDSGLTDGQTYGYRVEASDPFGNKVTSDSASVTIATGGSIGGPYATAVRNDGAVDHWRLGERSGTVYDYAGGGLDMTASSGVTRGQDGALTGDSDTAYRFNGSTSGLASTQTAVAGPQTFSIEAFVKTTSSSGGKIVGFGDKRSGTSSSYDRHVYLDRSGYLVFGVYPGEERTLRSTGRINDGQYHHVVATLSEQGMALYVDGALVASRADTTSAQAYDGYWRLGGDTTWGNSGTWFNGTIDEPAIYPTALSAEQVAAHYAAATTGEAVNSAPTASFTSLVSQLSVSLDAAGSTDSDGSVTAYAWEFGDGATGTGATASHAYAAAGTYPVTLTVTDDVGATGTATQSVTVTAPPPNVAPTASFAVATAQLALEVDGAGSSDTDGSVAAYAWEFGDGATGTGATASHAYAAAGTYTVTLTVTDDDGSTGTTEQEVTVAPAVSTALAADAFGRSSTSGWGLADTGGAWTISGGTTNATVSSSAGHLSIPRAGGSVAAYLNNVAAQDTAVQFDVRLGAPISGGATYVYSAARHVGSTDYRMGVGITPAGALYVQVGRMVNGAETVLRRVNLPDGSYPSGAVLTARFDVSGDGITALTGKVWAKGSSEPTDWQVTATDTTVELQRVGGVGVATYVSGAATALPVLLDIDDFWAGAAGTVPGGTEPVDEEPVDEEPVNEPPVNEAPTASFSNSLSGSTVTVDGSASTDTDGSLDSYTWDFGDGATGSGVTASHTYAAAGTYTVTLAVTDDDGATGTVSKIVTVAGPAVNIAPTADFSAVAEGPLLTVDGSASTDPDGSLTGYAWSFGDGATGSGVTASHTYAAAGTYSVTLTVTDDDGATASTSRQVTVEGPPAGAPVAQDGFSRDVTVGLGAAEIGGAWSIVGGAANASVSDGAARLTVPAPGRSVSAYVNGVSSLDTAVEFDASLDVPATGGGMYVYAAARHVGSSDYRLGLGIASNGAVFLQVSAMVDGVSSPLRSVTLPGLTYTPGSVLTVRFDVSGTGTATLAGKVWVKGSTEPAGWQVIATDSTAALQRPGGVGVDTYLSGSAAAVPVRLTVDGFWAGVAGAGRPVTP